MKVKVSLACIVLSIFIVICGCGEEAPQRNGEPQSRTPANSSLRATIEKYSNPPEARPWELVRDTEGFCKDMDILYQAASQGDRDAFRTLLIVSTYTDGVIAAFFPDVHRLAKENPEAASQIILQNTRLRRNYGHWIGKD